MPNAILPLQDGFRRIMRRVTWDDWDLDANLPAVLDEFQKNLNIIEQLRDDELATGFALQYHPQHSAWI